MRAKIHILSFQCGENEIKCLDSVVFFDFYSGRSGNYALTKPENNYLCTAPAQKPVELDKTASRTSVVHERGQQKDKNNDI